MIRKGIHIIVLLYCCSLRGQQLVQYSQFNLNKYGINPAAAGSSLKSPYEILFGVRRQWTDMDNPPKTNFVGVNYTFIPKRSYRKWHNVGLYVDQDQGGVFSNNSLYASYTFHLLVSRKLVAAFGVFAGVRRFFVSVTSLNISDPAVAKSSVEILTYPDIVPGFRLYNKKFFFDVSVRQLTTPQQSGSQKQIGGPSKLLTHIYASIGRKFFFENSHFALAPSLNMLTTLKYLPSFQGNLMLHYVDRFAVGVSVRGKNFVGAIVQVRFLKNATIGIAYDYSINKVRIASPHSFEIMMGVIPFSDATEKRGKSNNVAKCPALAF
jgi:type IX secretion system PorP/SprF family membrane protein